MSGGVFDLNGLGTNLGNLNGTGSVTLEAATLTVTTTSYSLFAGTISGAGGLWKSGSGYMALSGNNTFTGGTTISAGTLALAGTYSSNIADNAVLDLPLSASSGTLSNAISGSGAVTIGSNQSSLVQVLTGTNTYTGPTTVVAGILRLGSTLALPGGCGATGGLSNLVINQGASSTNTAMVELAAGSFDRGLGTAASQAQFLGSGGFSAYGANQVVNLGGASAKVTWGTGGFVPSYGMLMLGSPYSNAMIDFQNPIDFGNNRGSVWVQGTAAVDARLSGTLSSSGSGGLTENGPGTLELTAANTYTGQTVVSGVLRLSNSDALPGGTGAAGGTSNLLLGGGVVELNAGNFDRGLGTAASQVQLGSGGGFSAYGTNRVVNLGVRLGPGHLGQRGLCRRRLFSELEFPRRQRAGRFSEPYRVGQQLLRIPDHLRCRRRSGGGCPAQRRAQRQRDWPKAAPGPWN